SSGRRPGAVAGVESVGVRVDAGQGGVGRSTTGTGTRPVSAPPNRGRGTCRCPLLGCGGRTVREERASTVRNPLVPGMSPGDADFAGWSPRDTGKLFPVVAGGGS